MEDGMEDFWYGMEGLRYGMELYGRFCLLWKMEDLHSNPQYALPGTSIEYNEQGRVGIPAVRVVAVSDLSIVVSARLIETTLFMDKLLM